MSTTATEQTTPTGGQAAAAQQPTDELRSLASLYSFLARALSDDEIGADALASLAATANDLQTDTELDGFARDLAGLDGEGLERVRRELAADHASCLLGMSPHPVAPYASVYTSTKHLMMQEARDQAVHAYAKEGFAVDDACRIPEDHVSIELGFMAALLEHAAAGNGNEALRACRAYRDFVIDHALTWMPQFCDELERRAGTPFYRGAAQTLRTLLESERERLGSAA